MAKRIADLGEKIEFLEGASEFRGLRARILRQAGKRLDPAEVQKRLRLELQQKAYAKVIGVDPTQWSRIKVGTDPVKDHQLSALAAHLDLDEIKGRELWELPMAEFESALREIGYGKFGGPGGSADLAARLRAAAGETPRLRIVAVEGDVERGIGDPDDEGMLVSLRLGQRVRVEILDVLPGAHVLTLSEDPGRRLLVLGGDGREMPRASALGTLVLPSEKEAYPVGKPLGRHALYAVVFASRPEFALSLEDSGTGTGTLSMVGIAGLLEVLAKDGPPPAIGVLDYVVN